MKRIFALTIALCLVFGSVFPVYAATQQTQLIEFYDQSTHTATNAKTWADNVLTQISSVATRVYNCYSRLGTIVTALTDNTNSYILSNMILEVQKLTHLAEQFDTFLGSDGTTTITENWSEFTADMYKLVRFLAPISSSLPGSGNSFMTLWDYVFYEAGMINQLWGGWDTEFSNLTGIHSDTTNIATYTSPLRFGITNHYRGETTLSTYMKQVNGHSYLLEDDGSYTMPYYDSHGVVSTPASIKWQNGTPIGNVATILKLGFGQVAKLNGFMVGYFDDTLSIWDSQGNSLTQETWTPKSAINGIYKYFAYTQRDVARLAHVYASDEEIAARDKARTNQNAVVNNFVDSNGSGSVSPSDFGNIASAADSFKTNANTGASASGVWSVFDQNNYNWFSQTTANNLDTTNNNRKNSNEYDTPLLDSYYDYMTEYLKEN